jgi:hypothetical protein
MFIIHYSVIKWIITYMFIYKSPEYLMVWSSHRDGYGEFYLLGYAVYPLKANHCFGRTCHLDLQGRRTSQARNQHKGGGKQILVRTIQCYIPQEGIHHTISFLSHDTRYEHIPKQQNPWPEPVSKLYRPSDCHLMAKLVPTFADRRCRMVSVTDPYSRILGFLDWEHISN